MDEILRSEEMAQIEKIFAETFSYELPVIYFPIRHHSPACSYHLKKVMEEYGPECILVEGPQGGNELLDIMSHEDTIAPFAIYYSYRDNKGYISEEKDDYKCYYPFLDYSPELVAVREGKKRQVQVEFIDLPYSEILIASEQGKGLLKNEEKHNYNDDYLLTKSRYIEQIVSKTGLRSFDELWEKYFEINGIQESTGQFVKHMLAYCVLSRLHSDKDELEAEGCLSREVFMADNIRKKKKDFNKILVITGGFHTPGLVSRSEDKELLKEEYSLHTMDKEAEGVYIMPYSLEACDSLNGYASGMPFTGFYQDIYKELDNQNPRAYEETILKYIVSTGKEARKQEGSISSYDEICAYSMAQGLYALRGKKAPGVYELTDCILSSFVKGEYNPSTDKPLRILRKKLTGNGIGSLCKHAKIPPILKDFDEKCMDFNLKIHSTLSNEITLDIFSSKRHRCISEFLYQMEFLNTDFSYKVKGPDLRLKKNRNLIRETWKYKWNSQVIAALIDASVYGGTIEEACTAMVLKQLKKEMNSKEGALLLTRTYEMGMKEQLPAVSYRMETILHTDVDFFSLVEALSGLIMLEELNRLYLTELELSELIRTAYQKIISLLPFMAKIKEEDLAISMTALKTMYQLVQKERYSGDREVYYEALQTLLARGELQAGLEGCIRGILYGSGHLTASEIEDSCYGYMAGTHDKLLSGAKLIRGLFFTARDLVFVGNSFITMIDDFVAKIPEEDFMTILPELRMAFGYFTPGEIDEIARKAAEHHGKKGKELLSLKEIPPMLYKYGKELNEMVLKKMPSD